MKTTELRLGNLVELRGTHYQISSIHGDNTIRLKCDDENHKNYYHGSIGCYHINQCKPIILTQEWIKENAFTRGKDSYWWISFFRLHVNQCGELIFKHENFNIEIKYVHQLQNLYFALNNEELTFKTM